MRSYFSYVAGSDVPGESWIHTVRASALLGDVMRNLRLKRALDKGARDDAAEQPSIVARSALTSDADLERSLIKAREAAPKWAAFPVEKRMQLAERVHQEVLRRHDEFVEVLVAEGHPRKLSEWEIAGVLQGTSPATLDLWRSQLREETNIGQRQLLLVRKPDGVVCLSPPQNAAASNSVLGLPALVAGNALVVKAPRSSPFGVMFVWREIIAPILEDLGAPAGTLSIVCGRPEQVISQWLDSPLVDDIFFFGGSERGMKLGIDAVARGKKPVLELAGNDGCLIWHDADIDRAAEALTECFFGSGQICMVPKYAIVHPAVADRLFARLAELTADIRPGLPEDPEVLLSPVLRTDECFKYLRQALDAGAEVVTGGHRVEIDGARSETGPFVAPTVLRVEGLACADTLDAVREETFFPVLPVVVPEHAGPGLLDEVITFMNGNRYGLRNSVWAEDQAVLDQVIAQLVNGGLLKINDSHIGFVPRLSTHGGNGLTGGPFGELNYPLMRTSHLQGISIGVGVQPRTAVFESAATAPSSTARTEAA